MILGSLANSIAGQDPVSVRGSWQRHLPARYLPQAMEGRASYSRWGRARGFPVLYLGRPADSVVVEAYRHLVDPVDDPTILDHLAHGPWLPRRSRSARSLTCAPPPRGWSWA